MNLFKKLNSALIVIVLLLTFSLPVYADLFADEINEGTGTYNVDDNMNGQLVLRVIKRNTLPQVALGT